MSRPLNYTLLFLSVGIVLSSLPFQAAGQFIADPPQNSASVTAQQKPVSLPHLYWHFLVYVNTLDTKAAELESQGKDGSSLRNDLQKQARFSDSEFAAVRASSQRLTADLKTLNQQATGNTAGHPEPRSAEMEKSLGLKREALIDHEIAYLTQNLSPERKTSLDKFLAQFYAPKTISLNILPAQHTAPAAVQQ